MTRGFILIAAVIAFIVGCRPSDTVPMSDAGTLRSDWGVVLPAAQQTALLRTCSRPSPRGLTGPWMPARAEIDRLERRLASVLDTALARVILESGETRPTAADYYRQYGGFHREGLRVVYVNGLHRGIVQLRESPPWTEEPFGLCDGGFMGFGVVYEVDRDRFESIEFDGRFSGPVKTRWF